MIIVAVTLQIGEPARTSRPSENLFQQSTSAAANKTSRKAITQAQGRDEDEKIQARIRLASTVIVGKVATTRALRKEGKAGPITEHDPDWQVAEIEVKSVLKGAFHQPKITVIYPNSKDVMWFNAPRFRQGQEGIWILQEVQAGENAEEVTRELGGPAYGALDPLDFRAKSETARIRRLIARASKKQVSPSR